MTAVRQARRAPRRAQRGMVLFVALIALVIIMLAATALTRSVDTNTLITGNLAFRQAATASADAGVEAAVAWMRQTDLANLDKDPFTDATHPFNVSAPAQGYYSNADPALALTADSTWTAANSVALAADTSGNTVRYLIQRMCRTANQRLSPGDCLFSDATRDDDSKRTGYERPFKGGMQPLNRVTVRVTGPRNTVSYVQAFIY